tara:strand:- start:587 stop:1804 length:1218 start_codon:yes stop_codon:yes gene_type:complete
MTIKSKIILTSLAALTFFITSAYSITLTGKNGGTVEVKETDSVQVNMIEVPQNEKWMVDRVLFQSPSLTEKDISRVEYSFGVYYGEINKSGVAQGEGILGLKDENNKTQVGIESLFKNGKLDKIEQTIVSDGKISGDMIDLIVGKNRAFNNGFQLKGNLPKLLDQQFVDLANELNEDLEDQLFNSPEWKPSKNKAQEYLNKEWVAMDLIYADLIEAQKIFNTMKEELTITKLKSVNAYLTSAITTFQNLNLQYEMIFPPKDLSKMSIVSIFRDSMIRGRMSHLEEYVLELKQKKEIFDEKNLPILRALLFNTVIADDAQMNIAAEEFLNREENFNDIRLLESFNMRKNIAEKSIEAKADNGKWYDLEYVYIDQTITLQLSEEGKKSYEKDSKNEPKGGESGGNRH